MGTPDFAAAILRALCENQERWEVIGAVSQPDKPRGRGHKVAPTSVKRYAQEVGVPVYQPQSLRAEEASALLRDLHPDIIVVAAYGKILPKEFLDGPPFGCINVHGSLLPEYRGAAPIQRAVIEGRCSTGVTIMKMAEGLDTGDMLAKRAVDILPEDDAGSLFKRMEAVGAALLTETLPLYLDGHIIPEPQDDGMATYAAKIEKVDCRLDFTKSAEELHNLIRGLSPAPLAFATLYRKAAALEKRNENGGATELGPAPEQKQHTENSVVKFVKTEIAAKGSCYGPPGTVLAVSTDHSGIDIACGSGILKLVCLVPSGKGKMNAADFARGRGIAVGDRFI